MTQVKLARKDTKRSDQDIAAARAKIEVRRLERPKSEPKTPNKILSVQRMADEVSKRRAQHQVRLEQARLRTIGGLPTEVEVQTIAAPEPELPSIEIEATPEPQVETGAAPEAVELSALPAPPPQAAPIGPAPADPQEFETADEARLAAISAAVRAQREAEQGTVTPPAAAPEPIPEPPTAEPAPQDEPPITERGPAAETKEETPQA